MRSVVLQQMGENANNMNDKWMLGDIRIKKCRMK